MIEHRQVNASPSDATPQILDQVNSSIDHYFSRIVFAVLLFIASFSLCEYVIYLSTDHERYYLESNRKISCRPQYHKHNHRLSTIRQRRNAVPLLPRAEPRHSFAIE
jgi:hypothetical protein